MKKLFLLLALFALPAAAQVSYDTVTATVTDPSGNPYANASYSIILVSQYGIPVSSATTPNGQIFNARPVRGSLDSAGHMSVGLVPNNILSNPSGTQWQISILAPSDSSISTYAPAWNIQYSVAVTANVDLSSQLSALAQPIAYFNTKTGQNTGVNGSLPGVSTDGNKGIKVAGNSASKFINGIPQADQFAGSDFCAQLRAAALWAVANNVNLVDATHFPKTVSCSSDPLTALDGAGTGGTVALTVMLPASWISSTVAWNINNSGVTLVGKGDAQTIIAYTGVPVVAQVLAVGGSKTNAFYTDSVQVRDLSIIGGNANATDALAVEDAGHGLIQNVSTWGVTGCGVHTYNSVTETFDHDSTSASKAAHMGYFGVGYSVPADGICLDQTTPGSPSTDGTVTDYAAEGVSAAGWNLIAAQGMTFTGGTSESNGQGVKIAANDNLFNTFINSDFEANALNANGVDVLDQGYGDIFLNGIAISSCSGCNSVQLNGSSSIPNQWQGGKFTSIGGTQGTLFQPSPNFGAVFSSYGLGEGLAASSNVSASNDPFTIFGATTAAGNVLGMCFSVNDLFCNTNNSSNIQFRYWGLNNTSNGLEFGTPGGNLVWEGGVLDAGFGAHGLLGQINNGWWQSLTLGGTQWTLIQPDPSAAVNTTITFPSGKDAFVSITGGKQDWGVATLVGGTVTVSTTAACTPTTTSCNIQLTRCVAGGTLGNLSVGTISAGVSMVVNSSSNTETSQICWRIN